ncbi:hypothetical protein PF005_g28221 [Phytophthora fragariae]|uniref:Uncharacterized protein n=1 Tax=Phytophthora fragariae TaxID=53985 RepID=A0A6A3HDI9_9STRA|nr:hypothetical protein PF011_g27340 [Phytophthora fragariae]KAE9168826.1 hypothetical protein PF005_g28221 [Phytophthora fragariae]KAE9175314.1 hypothetical protein PF002_g28825 [Phytophthora fragariae]
MSSRRHAASTLNTPTEPQDLLAELFKADMKGFGTDEKALSAAVVRCHLVLRDIKPV